MKKQNKHLHCTEAEVSSTPPVKTTEQSGTQVNAASRTPLISSAIRFHCSTTPKPEIHGIGPWAIKAIRRHENILIITEKDGYSAIVLQTDAASKQLLAELFAGSRSKIEMKDPVLGFLWDDFLTGMASVAGLKRLPKQIGQTIEQFGLVSVNYDPTGTIISVAANMEEISSELGWICEASPPAAARKNP